MAIVLLIVALLGLLAATVGSIWFIVNAFRTHILWGVLCYLFTPAWIRFSFKHWDMARQPLMVTIFGVVFGFGATQTLANTDAYKQWTGKFSEKMAAAAATGEKKHALPPMFEAQKKMELQIRLVALQKRENDLLQRKSELDPKDRQGAIALTEEIKKYNEELKPVLQEMRDRGMVAAQ
jgi:hypothetical protein